MLWVHWRRSHHSSMVMMISFSAGLAAITEGPAHAMVSIQTKYALRHRVKWNQWIGELKDPHGIDQPDWYDRVLRLSGWYLSIIIYIAWDRTASLIVSKRSGRWLRCWRSLTETSRAAHRWFRHPIGVGKKSFTLRYEHGEEATDERVTVVKNGINRALTVDFNWRSLLRRCINPFL